MARIPKIVLLLEPARTCEREFLRGVARYAYLHGPWAFYRKPRFYLKSNRGGLSITQIRDFDPDGIIVSDTEKIEEIMRLGKPTLIHTFKTDRYAAPMIVGDVQQIGVMAAEHLMGLGFTHFAYCGMGDYYWSVRRYDSFEQTLRQRGYSAAYFELNPQRIKTALQKELRRLTDWLRSLPAPVGLMACADDCCQHIVEACTMADIKIPETIALIGVDNDDMVCDLSDPPLSSIALDFDAAGYEAAELLDQLMAGQAAQDTVITVRPSHIEVRASTDSLAIEDADVAAAVRFIRQQANQLIQIADVMNEVTCCQRLLHEKFIRILGRSVHQEIKRVRSERIANMLRKTDMPISQIATKLGYFSANHLSRYFKQAAGMTPLAYRKRFGAT
jgi:LacI family transcriptional regulator